MSTSTRKPKIFLAQEDAEDLYQALSSSPVDTSTIANILGRRTLIQRLEIIDEYKTLHDADLVADAKSKLSGDFKNVVVATLTPLDQFYAQELNRAMEGLGTNESILIEILCTLNNKAIQAAQLAYQQQYQLSLEDSLIDETSGYFRDLLVSLNRRERDENMQTDENAAVADADNMYHATTDNRWSIFSDVLIHRSYNQLRIVFDQFEKVFTHGIETAIQDYFGGDERDGLLAIVQNIKNKAAFFAKKFNESMAGLGTRDQDLVRLAVIKSETDIDSIKAEYVATYSNTLAADIIDDTSGDYQRLLILLIGEEPTQKKK